MCFLEGDGEPLKGPWRVTSNYVLENDLDYTVVNRLEWVYTEGKEASKESAAHNPGRKL